MRINNSHYSKTRRKNNIPRLPCPTGRQTANRSRKVLIFGLGLNGGGIGSAKFFSRQGAKITITDLKTQKALKSSLKELSGFPDIKYVLGRHRLTDFLASDLIVKNPAIPWDNPFLKKARAKGIPVTTDAIVFFSQTPARVIGVTGTKGKSTTATLLAGILKKKYRKVWLLGNIRESFLEKLPRIKTGDIVVAELSSFQLEDLALIKKSPQIAVITNIFPDHLNRYASFKDYVKAKTNIFLYQKPEDHLIINGNDKFLTRLIKNACLRRQAKAKRHLLKNKNLSPLEINTALAAETAKILGVPAKKIAEMIKNFRGLAGRQELIRKFKNRIFINDTTATNPTAVIMALESLGKKYRRPIILIAGGENKNLDYENLAAEINNRVKKLVLLPGSATEKLKKHLRINPIGKISSSNGAVFFEVKNMEEAVKKSCRISQAGDLVLLSPGAASFNLFQNEFDRGDQFNKNVKKLRK